MTQDDHDVLMLGLGLLALGLGNLVFFYLMMFSDSPAGEAARKLEHGFFRGHYRPLDNVPQMVAAFGTSMTAFGAVAVFAVLGPAGHPPLPAALLMMVFIVVGIVALIAWPVLILLPQSKKPKWDTVARAEARRVAALQADVARVQERQDPGQPNDGTPQEPPARERAERVVGVVATSSMKMANEAIRLDEYMALRVLLAMTGHKPLPARARRLGIVGPTGGVADDIRRVVQGMITGTRTIRLAVADPEAPQPAASVRIAIGPAAATVVESVPGAAGRLDLRELRPADAAGWLLEAAGLPDATPAPAATMDWPLTVPFAVLEAVIDCDATRAHAELAKAAEASPGSRFAAAIAAGNWRVVACEAVYSGVPRAAQRAAWLVAGDSVAWLRLPPNPEVDTGLVPVPVSAASAAARIQDLADDTAAAHQKYSATYGPTA